MFDNHDSFTRNEIKPMYIYLFVGLGIVFILLIFIMIIELYKRVKLAKGKMVIEQPCDETRLRGESSNNGTLCNSSSRQFREKRPHLLVDFENADIHGVVEMPNIHNSDVSANESPGVSNRTTPC